MKKSQLAVRARHGLDRRFAELPPSASFAPPVRGWIKAIREALGMTTAQLAKRMTLTQPTIVAMERSEVEEKIQLATLKRVAVALDCKLVYALVPNQPLETMVQDQARKVARRRLRSTDHTMLLENQQTKPADLEAQIDAYVQDVNPRTLWDVA
jgi:predicted DNA-binding mobile mystery protein A